MTIKSKILAKAKRLIANDSAANVCLALYQLANEPSCDCKAEIADLVTWIKRDLLQDKFMTLEDWLSSNVGDYWDHSTSFILTKTKSTRLAWVDWMIEAHKREGS